MVKSSEKQSERVQNTAPQALALCIRYATQLGRAQRALRLLPGNLQHYVHLAEVERAREQKKAEAAAAAAPPKLTAAERGRLAMAGRFQPASKPDRSQVILIT